MSEGKLERWNAEGLINRRQTHPPGVKGSQTEYALGTARRALDIARLLKVARNLDSVGWLLWLEGQDVPERFWRTRFEKVVLEKDWMIAEIRELGEEDNSALWDEIEDLSRRDLPPHFRRRIPENQICNVVGTIVAMLFGAFNTELDKNENKAILSATGITEKKSKRSVEFRSK